MALTFTFKSADAQDTRFGLKGGITLYKGTLSFGGIEETTNSSMGFTGGLYVEFPLSEYLSVQPEASYIQKSVEDTNEFIDGNNVTTFTYVDVPLLLRLNVPLEGTMSPFVTAGPYVGYLLDATNDSDSETEDISEFMNDLNYGIIIGGGLQFGNLSVEVRYDIGMANIYNNDLIENEFAEFDDLGEFGDFFGGSSFEGKLSGLSVTAGISF